MGLTHENDRLPRIQFNLRTIFFFTLIISMASATIGPAFRGWNSEKRWVFLGMLLVQAIIFSGIFLSCWFTRRRIIVNAGPIRLRSSFLTRRYSTVGAKLKAMLPLVLAISYQAVLLTVISNDTQSSLILATFTPQVQCTYFLASSCAAYWFHADSQDMEICERGYIYGAYHFVPWESLVSVRPASFGADTIVVVLLDAIGMKVTLSYATDAEMRDEIVHHLSARLKSVETPENVASISK